ncbi:hypothetical protein N898_13125 [Salmonella enterica subsp. arizonae serovar 62:z36:- str. RKS2983]|nr:hypothetical protein N898_13125 [Salmonella enterica subsp. arizonae serovar 62:z36:- str. RKS2983]
MKMATIFYIRRMSLAIQRMLTGMLPINLATIIMMPILYITWLIWDCQDMALENKF